MQIPFNEPFLSGNEEQNLSTCLSKTKKFSGDGPFTKEASSLLEQKLNAKKVLLTTSCTHALEMSALLCDIKPGDEIIIPSYTFVSTANAFVLRGATPVWVDVDLNTFNIDLESVKKSITKKTKAIAPVHYAGFSCDMDALLEIADSEKLYVIEDAAQAIGAEYKNKPLGSQGNLSSISFHETKNLHCGEGGALIINDPNMIERAEIIREKGTNRSKFFRGQVDKYTWVDIGSSYLPSELNASFLLAQLEKVDEITTHRRSLWDRYYSQLQDIPEIRTIQKTSWNNYNGHIFFLLTETAEKAVDLMSFLKSNGVISTFHYLPLHTSPYGRNVGITHTQLNITEKHSYCVVRLPMFYNLTIQQVDYVCDLIRRYYKK